MSDQPQWSALVVGSKIYGIFRLPGASQWRYLKQGGKKREFANEREARSAARDRALEILFPPITGTLPLNDKKVADSLGVEDWIKSKRADEKAARMIHKPGRKVVVVMKGRARA